MEGFFVQEQQIPKFAHLQYEVLHTLDISITEYWYLDMIYYLSRDGWCYKSLESIAKDMKMTKNGVLKLRDRLIEKKLVLKDHRGYVRSSVTYNKVYLQDELRTTKLPNRYKKYTSIGIKSSTKTNNETNKEKNVSLLNKNGTISLQAMEARIKRNVGGIS